MHCFNTWMFIITTCRISFGHCAKLILKFTKKYRIGQIVTMHFYKEKYEVCLLYQTKKLEVLCNVYCVFFYCYTA